MSAFIINVHVKSDKRGLHISVEGLSVLQVMHVSFDVFGKKAEAKFIGTLEGTKPFTTDEAGKTSEEKGAVDA